ncbi:cobalt transporter CbiM [Candidatus Synechococcus calcipolaris G9]|uniref:Cobalt transporter CbiM n=1 Tax=Candidatus Synechococcus calcipolaris G9 TaxID=1497997 RepID=A0ABT6EUB4_9SYNE|nr:cobalt transporter CbiM [Candidatus Synechococcus calcipolaris]MDG2989475.1 cobalt transporter CbiM [Candidatus Synechococcus calcipolaris G9]
MHIPDGILPPSVCLTGYGATGLLTWASLKQLQRQYTDTSELVPRTAFLTAAFFAVSLIHIPVPPTSVHLMLPGLMGVLLGYAAMPAILIGVFLQAVMFGHGGLTTVGVNTLILGIPALVAYHIFASYRWLGRHWPFSGGRSLWAFLAGASGVVVAVCLFSGLLLGFLPTQLDRETEQLAIFILVMAHLPLVIIEGVMTAAIVNFLGRVKPELLY